MNPLFAYAKFAAAAIVGILLAVALWKVNSWRVDAAEKAKLEGLLTEEREARNAHAQADAHTDRTSRKVETAIASSSAAAEKVRVIYREAKREDPDCAAWAAAPVACPLGDWLPAPAPRPSGGVPGDPGEPDARLRNVQVRGPQAHD